MEYIIKKGVVHTVVNRYKTIINETTGKVVALPLRAVYRIIGGKVVEIWTLIRSCFGSGYWRNDRPWSNTDYH